MNRGNCTFFAEFQRKSQGVLGLNRPVMFASVRFCVTSQPRATPTTSAVMHTTCQQQSNKIDRSTVYSGSVQWQWPWQWQ